MEDFFSRIQPLLSEEEFVKFKNEYQKLHLRGVRVNILKCSRDKFLAVMQKEGENFPEAPFCECGFYINEDSTFSGKHPLHHAGAVYFQEPSAMSAVTLLAPKEGDKVLDLCAAPGGKSTQIASMLAGKGLLWCNEYVKSRANILLSNIERCGVRNSVVSSSDAETLCSSLEGFFDKVLVDAPCSGEGMFRRDERAKEEWSAEHSDSCSVRQLHILKSAGKALRPGGEMVYSTCTFSKAENEDVVEKFLLDNPEFELVNTCENFGRKGVGGVGTRIFPMDGGEGHFAVKLKKREDAPFACGAAAQGEHEVTDIRKIPAVAKDFFEATFKNTDMLDRAYINGDKLFIIPEGCPLIKGTGALRAGVLAGVVKKGYFDPAHALFMAANPADIKQVVDMELSDERLIPFLKGEEISVSENFSGYTAVAVCSVITGFGKVSSGRLKNKYPKGLRLM